MLRHQGRPPPPAVQAEDVNQIAIKECRASSRGRKAEGLIVSDRRLEEVADAHPCGSFTTGERKPRPRTGPSWSTPFGANPRSLGCVGSALATAVDWNGFPAHVVRYPREAMMGRRPHVAELNPEAGQALQEALVKSPEKPFDFSYGFALKRWRAAREATGGPTLRIHDLSHYTTTALLYAVVPIQVVRDTAHLTRRSAGLPPRPNQRCRREREQGELVPLGATQETPRWEPSGHRRSPRH